MRNIAFLFPLLARFLVYAQGMKDSMAHWGRNFFQTLAGGIWALLRTFLGTFICNASFI